MKHLKSYNESISPVSMINDILQEIKDDGYNIEVHPFKNYSIDIIITHNSGTIDKDEISDSINQLISQMRDRGYSANDTFDIDDEVYIVLNKKPL